MVNVELTDDELSLVVTSLVTTVAGYKKYIEKNEKDSPDHATLKTIEEMNVLYKKLDSKFL